MLRNMKAALAAHLGLCLAAILMGAGSPRLPLQLFYSFFTIAAYIVVGKAAFKDSGSRLSNFISISAVSAISLVISSGCTILYQSWIINRYSYLQVPVSYKLLSALSKGYNSPVTPIANLAGRISDRFLLPYGWLLVFYFPSVIMWLSFESKLRKERSVMEIHT